MLLFSLNYFFRNHRTRLISQSKNICPGSKIGHIYFKFFDPYSYSDGFEHQRFAQHVKQADFYFSLFLTYNIPGQLATCRNQPNQAIEGEATLSGVYCHNLAEGDVARLIDDHQTIILQVICFGRYICKSIGYRWFILGRHEADWAEELTIPTSLDKIFPDISFINT